MQPLLFVIMHKLHMGAYCLLENICHSLKFLILVRCWVWRTEEVVEIQISYSEFYRL
jgi:hypothetical protein